jgi:hypothetical protein
MNRKFTLGLVLGVLVAAIAATGMVTYAQAKRPFRDGSVWSMNFIRMKPGMESAYLTYIATEWKKEQEALKKDGLILSYKVITSEGHSPTDWNIVLMTEFKNLATMEANADKAEAVSMAAVGADDQKMRQGYKDRLEIREIIGDRTAREVVLEPKP